jgi:hypothetical protein
MNIHMQSAPRQVFLIVCLPPRALASFSLAQTHKSQTAQFLGRLLAFFCKSNVKVALCMLIYTPIASEIEMENFNDARSGD